MLGVVGSHFLAFASKLSSFSFHNITASSIGPNFFYGSAVAEVDVDGLHLKMLGETTCPYLTRVIATAATNVQQFAGRTVERVA